MAQAEVAFNFDEMLYAERARLVGLCAYLSGDASAADDLAQETLIEAWRNADKLIDPSGYQKWLNAIARNVCQRWARRRGREMARSVQVADFHTDTFFDTLWVDDADPARHLERDDLARALEKALAQLPAKTQSVVIQRYIEAKPQAEVAARLGMSESAVSVRLHRGKAALRRVLETELSAEIAPYGVDIAQDTQWQQTHIWCPECGQRKMIGLFTQDRFALKCPDCHHHDDVVMAKWHGWRDPILDGVKTFKPALNRVMKHVGEQYHRGLEDQFIPCPKCGQIAQVKLGIAPCSTHKTMNRRWLHVACPYCDQGGSVTLDGVALYHEAGRKFWREHPRIRTIYERDVTVQGRDAVIVSFESIATAARLDMLYERNTYHLLFAHRSNRPTVYVNTGANK